MRFVIAGLILAMSLPAAHASACKSACSSQYHFCLQRSTTKLARQGCKATRKLCKNQCSFPKR
jgi:hypothetical protein